MCASILRKLRRLFRDESGPTAVEYAVMLGMIIMVIIGSVRLLGTNSKSSFQDAAKALYRKTDGKQDGNGQW